MTDEKYERAMQILKNEMNIEIYFLSKDNKKSGSSKFTYLITENGIKNTKMKKPILN